MSGAIFAVLASTGETPLSAGVFPSTVSGTNTVVGAPNPVSVTATTDNATTTAGGGQPPYAYLWQYVSGDTATVLSPTNAVTAFSRTVTQNAFFSVTRTGVYRCRVTDALSTVVFTGNVTVETTHTAEL
jgi:hypothetical protein